MNQSYIYDIRTSESALCTLVNFTGVIPPIWQKYILLRENYYYDEDLVEDVIKNHGSFPTDYESWIFTCFHITTSANECKTFQEYGILDLKRSYSCPESELRMFLDKRGVEIDIDNRKLQYKGRLYDISFGDYPSGVDTEEHKCWDIGRKLYYDFAVCGFLSVCDTPYGGNVHLRPEILYNIDNLLGLSLQQEWMFQHEPYEITVLISGKDILYDGDDNQSNKDKILNYLTKAYNTAFGLPQEEIVILKDNVQVSSNRIVETKALKYW